MADLPRGGFTLDPNRDLQLAHSLNLSQQHFGQRVVQQLDIDAGAFGTPRADFFRDSAFAALAIDQDMRRAFDALTQQEVNLLRQHIGFPDVRDMGNLDGKNREHEAYALYYHEQLAVARTAVMAHVIEPHIAHDARTLEIGCGYGELAELMRERRGEEGGTYYAADIGDARKPWVNKGESFQFAPGQLLRDARANGADGLDNIVAVSVLHHVLPGEVYGRLGELQQQEREQQLSPGSLQRNYLDTQRVAAEREVVGLLKDVRDLLKPGGEFIAIEDYIGDAREERAKKDYVIKHDLHVCPDYQGVHRTVADWRRLAQEAGLELSVTQPFHNLSEAGHAWQHVKLVFRRPEEAVE